MIELSEIYPPRNGTQNVMCDYRELRSTLVIATVLSRDGMLYDATLSAA